MQTLTIAITNDSAIKTLHELEEKHFIKIVSEVKNSSPAVPGDPLSIAEFQQWIKRAEEMPTVSLEEAKSIWSKKKKLLADDRFSMT